MLSNIPPSYSDTLHMRWAASVVTDTYICSFIHAFSSFHPRCTFSHLQHAQKKNVGKLLNPSYLSSPLYRRTFTKFENMIEERESITTHTSDISYMIRNASIHAFWLHCNALHTVDLKCVRNDLSQTWGQIKGHLV